MSAFENERDPTELPLPRLLSMTTDRVLTTCKQFTPAQPDMSTLFITSYPKSGTTWLQCVIYHILTKGLSPLPETNEHISHFTPFYEIERTWSWDTTEEKESGRGKLKDLYSKNHQDLLHWHVFNTHLPFRCLPQNTNADKSGPQYKYIYIVRNGKDVVNSFYHHLSNQMDSDQYTAGFSQFVQDFLSGQLPYGSWIEHIHEYLYSNKKNKAGSELASEGGSDVHHCPTILFLQYEDLIRDLRTQVEKIVDYLELSKEFLLEEDYARILPMMSFRYMKEQSACFAPTSVEWTPGFHFIRKGQPGDHQSSFQEEDYRLFQVKIQSYLEAIGYGEEDGVIVRDDGIRVPAWLRDFASIL